MGDKQLGIIEGNDWSTVKTNLSDVGIVSDDTQNSEEQTDISEYFECFKSLFGISDHISPVNLGLYCDGDNNIKSAQFVGVMPLINRKSFKPRVGTPCVIKVNSRFHISPSEMLKEVLDGDDYYENPAMLQCKDYKISELKHLFGRGEKNKVLCGTVKDIGKITLEQKSDSGNNSSSLDPLLSDVYPIFEIIRFVSLAKDICKKNLKQQSTYKEENLVGKIKGRILINKQVKHNLSRGQFQKTYCGYNSLSENIKENIIIKYTLHLCSKFSIADSLKEDIMFCNRVLANVPLKKCGTGDFIGLKSNGAFRQYSQTLDAAKDIISKYYISYDNASSETGEGGIIKVADRSITPYFVDMNLLFEFYCRALFRKAINSINEENGNYHLKMDPPSKTNIELFANNAEEKSAKKISDFYMKSYIPDIVIRRKTSDNNTDKIISVIDAKYSDVQHSSDKRARTHQVLFYMNVLDCLSGGLISPYMTDKDLEHVLSEKYLYDGKSASRQELCYIPLSSKKEENTSLSDKYVKIIKGYLKNVLDKQPKNDEKESVLKALIEDIRKNLKPDNSIKFTSELKDKFQKLFDKYNNQI